MPINFGKAVRTNRGVHPDLTEDGELRDDVDLPAGEKAFRRMWNDEAQREAFMQRVAREQAELPGDVQQDIAGRTFGTDPYWGYVEYRSEIEHLRRVPGNPLREITGADVERMDLETYNQYFDENGKPREGITFHPTGRDVDVSRRESIDPFSQRELRNR